MYAQTPLIARQALDGVGECHLCLVHPRSCVAPGKSFRSLWMLSPLNVSGTWLGALSVNVTKISLELVSGDFSLRSLSTPRTLDSFPWQTSGKIRQGASLLSLRREGEVRRDQKYLSPLVRYLPLGQPRNPNPSPKLQSGQPRS